MSKLHRAQPRNHAQTRVLDPKRFHGSNLGARVRRNDRPALDHDDIV
jgi:hypothetical protein